MVGRTGIVDGRSLGFSIIFWWRLFLSTTCLTSGVLCDYTRDCVVEQFFTSSASALLLARARSDLGKRWAFSSWLAASVAVFLDFSEVLKLWSPMEHLALGWLQTWSNGVTTRCCSSRLLHARSCSPRSMKTLLVLAMVDRTPG